LCSFCFGGGGVFRYEAGTSSVVKPSLSNSGSPIMMSFMVVLSAGATTVSIYSYNAALALLDIRRDARNNSGDEQKCGRATRRNNSVVEIDM
jgi:hypothetical protein